MRQRKIRQVLVIETAEGSNSQPFLLLEILFQSFTFIGKSHDYILIRQPSFTTFNLILISADDLKIQLIKINYMWYFINKLAYLWPPVRIVTFQRW